MLWLCVRIRTRCGAMRSHSAWLTEFHIVALKYWSIAFESSYKRKAITVQFAFLLSVTFPYVFLLYSYIILVQLSLRKVKRNGKAVSSPATETIYSRLYSIPSLVLELTLTWSYLTWKNAAHWQLVPFTPYHFSVRQVPFTDGWPVEYGFKACPVNNSNTRCSYAFASSPALDRLLHHRLPVEC